MNINIFISNFNLIHWYYINLVAATKHIFIITLFLVKHFLYCDVVKIIIKFISNFCVDRSFIYHHFPNNNFSFPIHENKLLKGLYRGNCLEINPLNFHISRV